MGSTVELVVLVAVLGVGGYLLYKAVSQQQQTAAQQAAAAAAAAKNSGTDWAGVAQAGAQALPEMLSKFFGDGSGSDSGLDDYLS